MRKSAFIAGLVLCVPILVARPHAHAEAPNILLGNSSTITEGQKALQVVTASIHAQSAEAPKPVEHVVSEGETLTSIAQQYQTSWQRLFAKNTQLANPNVIDVGVKVTIPAPDEQLADRAVPEPTPALEATPRSVTKTAAVSSYSYRGSSGGNSYTPGYCTWYAKSRRPDLPNNLGNAISWVSQAAAQGIPTGSTPQAGAIGQSGNHVVYIESVNGDGSVNVSEMNHVGVGIVSTRTVAGNYFSYIY